jgi:hypothetical protein
VPELVDNHSAPARVALPTIALREGFELEAGFVMAEHILRPMARAMVFRYFF